MIPGEYIDLLHFIQHTSWDCTFTYIFGAQKGESRTFCSVSLFFILGVDIYVPAEFDNLLQDVLWCFSQVKGTIDAGVTEGRFMFPFVLGMKENLFSCTN